MRQSDWIAQLFVGMVFGNLALTVGASVAYTILYPLFWAERLPLSKRFLGNN